MPQPTIVSPQFRLNAKRPGLSQAFGHRYNLIQFAGKFGKPQRLPHIQGEFSGAAGRG
jgi:hypothetical protein